MLARSSGRRFSRRQVLAAAAATAIAPVRGFDQATPEASPIASPAATPVAGGGPTLEVYPASVRVDERFDIVVYGVEPGQDVTITSVMRTASQSWTASATYTAQTLFGAPPTFGYVDPAAMTPASGSFAVADTMAFVWAATAPGSPFYAFPQPGELETITITAAIGDMEIGSAVVERSIPASSEPPVYIYEEGLVGTLYRPATASTSSDLAPAVIVIGGSDGGLSAYSERTASMLAAHGYATLTLAYCKIGDLPRVFENIPLEYFGTAIAWLQRQPGIDPERIAIHGTSRGGEGALLIGSYFPEIKAVVSNMGSGYVVAAPWNPTPTPAWTWRGEPLPYLPWDAAPTSEAIARAEIPVERINGPVLMIGADADGLWPSSAWSQVALDRLHRYQHPWPYQLLRYPGAGHAIGEPYHPIAPFLGSYAGLEFGGDAHSNAIANANSWPAILAMLETRLQPQDGSRTA